MTINTNIYTHMNDIVLYHFLTSHWRVNKIGFTFFFIRNLYFNITTTET